MSDEPNEAQRAIRALIIVVAVSIAAVLLLLGIVFGIVAIWTVGPNSGRWAATSGLLIILGICSGVAAAVMTVGTEDDT